MLDAEVDQAALRGDPEAVLDIELGLAERRRDLVLDDLGPHPVADRLGALLERLDAADVDALRGVELERPAARLGLRATEHDADLLADLVGEDADGVRSVEVPGQLSQRLGHQPGLEADGLVAHLALELRARRQRRHRVDRDDVDGAGADQHVRDLERLLAVVGLRDEHLLDVHADPACVGGVDRVLGVDEGANAAGLLGLGDDLVDERRLSRRLGAEDLDDAPAGNAARRRARGPATARRSEIAATGTAESSPRRIREPWPNWRSICVTAAWSAAAWPSRPALLVFAPARRPVASLDSPAPFAEPPAFPVLFTFRPPSHSSAHES